MAWEKFNPNLAAHDLVQDMKWDVALRKEFKTNESAVLDRYKLLPEERKAIEARDFRALYDLGMHPYLGGQLSRFIWGNDAGKGAVEASNKLVASLQGHDRDIPKT
jgi:Aromatic-ring-opening dioxygenase LigAB, LigA subunit